MTAMRLFELTAYLDEYLRISEIPDYPNALNGLQVETDVEIRRIAVAVDASEQAIAEAVRNNCNLLIAHHGLFWGGLQPVTGRLYRKLNACLTGNLAVYGCHIPLDLHPEVGNSAVLLRAIGCEPSGVWGDYRGLKIGVWGELSVTREALAASLETALGGSVRMIAGGKERVLRVGVITGAAANYIGEAIALGLDAFVTGEGAHHTYFDAMEGGLNLYFGGHYRTETWGVRALAAHLEKKFGLAWTFLDLPTGL
jgi:dinuclear metal center YbgI/SA1388 family protein